MRSLNLQKERFRFYIIKKLSNLQERKVVAKQGKEMFSFFMSPFCQAANY